jgi:photosynthetic reaction center cytochrome c subunit
MRSIRTLLSATAVVVAATLLAGCERPPIDTVQWGHRGTAMVQVYNPRTVEGQIDKNQAPAPLDPIPAVEGGPKAKDVYQNVQVLGDLGVGEFTRLMVAMTNWVSPEQGCNYCHNAENFADDSLYTKIVARRMVQMTQHINEDWKAHVADTGVTCYTCHRGQPVPAEVWFAPVPDRQASRMVGSKAEQNSPAYEAALSSLPYDPYTPFLLEAKEIRVGGTTALPSGNRQSTKQAEYTYSLMMHMSESLGVNCTYCHNSRVFNNWEESTPQRGTAWYGIRMARDLNNEYVVPLTSNFPVNRLGPTGDVAKINCATCHQGAYKPLYGAQMLAAHPELATQSKPQAPEGEPTAALSSQPAN